MTVYVSGTFNQQFKNVRNYGECVDVNTKFGRFQDLSPMRIGPCRTYTGAEALRFENLWQYSLVRKHQLDEDNSPTIDYIEWREDGWSRRVANMHPFTSEPLYCFWDDQLLSLPVGKKTVYAVEYIKHVVCTDAWEDLRNMYEINHHLTLVDVINGFDYTENNIPLEDILDYDDIPISNTFVLAMMLENKLEDCIGVSMEELVK